MNIALSPDLEQFLAETVRSGAFQSASEAVAEAVRLLKEQGSRRETLRQDIAVGVRQLNAGQFSEHNDASLDQFFAGIKAVGRSRLATNEKNRTP